MEVSHSLVLPSVQVIAAAVEHKEALKKVVRLDAPVDPWLEVPREGTSQPRKTGHTCGGASVPPFAGFSFPS